MQLTVTGHHLDMTDSLENYVKTKLERVERHFDSVTNVHVVLSVEKTRQRAEATVHIKGSDIHAMAEDADMYAAIDALSDKLDRQVKKQKEKRTDHHQNEGRAQKTSQE